MLSDHFNILPHTTCSLLLFPFLTFLEIKETALAVSLLYPLRWHRSSPVLSAAPCFASSSSSCRTLFRLQHFSPTKVKKGFSNALCSLRCSASAKSTSLIFIASFPCVFAPLSLFCLEISWLLLLHPTFWFPTAHRSFCNFFMLPILGHSPCSPCSVESLIHCL